MFGYNMDTTKLDLPVSWGHITCGGTVANLESTCLKFYPFSIFKAMKPGGLLNFVSENFRIKTCKGEEKLFLQLDSWELSNLRPHDILDIPDRLGREYDISPTFMATVLSKYSIQETGKDVLTREFDLKDPQYMLSTTRHYSWPKGAAIAGIGASNVIGIPVDPSARIDINKLRDRLHQNLATKQSVYAVVAIIGSTEEGSVDDLTGILEVRDEFQKLGMSFLVHGDAAWGGYFATMLPTDIHMSPGRAKRGSRDSSFVPNSALRTETQEDLFALRFADSITVDPHKAGYVPYPAGGLCYRDERMRYLVTWTSPYLSRGASTSMGIYGVEGSKPGAAAMSTWLSNTCIGMGVEGYGALLGEVTFTCSRFSAEWAAMTSPDMDFKVVPLNMLPSEMEPGSTPQKVEAEKQRIRDTILSKTNAEIVAADAGKPESEKSLTLLRALGSDLNINAFTLNFRLESGVWNTDVEEANYLMSRVIQRLSVYSPDDDISALEFVLTSTDFSKELYGDCMANFKTRLGLRVDDIDLMVLRNVVMSPWPTAQNFVGTLAGIFKRIVEEEIKKRNSTSPTRHHLLLQGKQTLYMIHIPTFMVANHRQQLIVEVEIDVESKKKYLSFKEQNASEQIYLLTHPIQLPKTLSPGTKFSAEIKTDKAIIVPHTTVTISQVVKSRPLNSAFRDSNYPKTFTSFYLFGNKEEVNIDHMLLLAPNSQFTAEDVKLDLNRPLTDQELVNGPLLYVQDFREEPSQPFPSNADLQASKTFWFKPGRKMAVKVYRDTFPATASGPGLTKGYENPENELASGYMTLGDHVFVDTEHMNLDPFKKPERVVQWQEEFNKIGESMRSIPHHK
ncbi:PLP-dependent transferase [Mollisia scopiformis]|uniref:PLP-dependent transferase n=1 Tax=Mollisia scopiformis TaxID=149040 RepID=A0A194XID0_MOLSC|nr:PLP-dependent transferase [Mollisia scopiformis]KUJ19918.1 PLP-dependent transferase [Mollisia scopiformis]